MLRPIVLLALLGFASACSSSDEKVVSSDPIGFTFESAPGSVASFGWSGEVHNIIDPGATPFGVTTTACQGDVCRFEGPTNPGGKVNRQRCLFHMSQTCTIDTKCPIVDGKPTPCVFIYDTPVTQHLANKGNTFGACAWSYIPIGPPGQPTIAGTINLTSGELNLEKLTVLLPLNAIAGMPGKFHGACAECVKDTTANDGIKDGHCERTKKLGDLPAPPDDGPDLGAPCDLNRLGSDDGINGNYSMDCAPTVERIFDAQGNPSPPLAFGGSFTSSGAVVTLGPSSPRCTDGSDCFCGTCAGTAQACTSNAECPTDKPCVNPTAAQCFGPAPTGPGLPRVCSTNDKLFPVYSNACADGMCKWDDAAGMGRCLRKGDNMPIGCYPDHGLVVEGHHERDDHVGTVYRASTGRASCIALSPENAGLNQQLGLPGMLFQKRNFVITPKYEDQP